MKTITTNISNCFECPHYDHSGAFTQGGAIPLCGKTRDKQSKYYWKYLPSEAGLNPRTGNPQRKATGKIPDWCPL